MKVCVFSTISLKVLSQFRSHIFENIYSCQILYSNTCVRNLKWAGRGWWSSSQTFHTWDKSVIIICVSTHFTYNLRLISVISLISVNSFFQRRKQKQLQHFPLFGITAMFLQWTLHRVGNTLLYVLPTLWNTVYRNVQKFSSKIIKNIISTLVFYHIILINFL